MYVWCCEGVVKVFSTTRSASCRPASTSPLLHSKWTTTFVGSFISYSRPLKPCMSGLTSISFFIASSGSVTAGKLLVVDVDEFERPLRDLLVVRDDRGDLLADEAHLALREHGHVDDAASPAHVRRDVVAGEHDMDTGQRLCRRRRRCRVCGRAGRGCGASSPRASPGSRSQRRSWPSRLPCRARRYGVQACRRRVVRWSYALSPDVVVYSGA